MLQVGVISRDLITINADILGSGMPRAPARELISLLESSNLIRFTNGEMCAKSEFENPVPERVRLLVLVDEKVARSH